MAGTGESPREQPEDQPAEQAEDQPAEQPEDQPADPAEDQPADPSRRQFFRAFSRQTVQGAGNVLRAADQLRRGSATAAGELLGVGLRDPLASAARIERRAVASASPIEARDLARQGLTGDATAGGFHSPYLFRGESLVLLDQREPPASGATVECREASEVATAIAAGVAGGGPVLAQIAAYALVLAAATSEDRRLGPRRAIFAAAGNILRNARPAARSIGWAVERLNRQWRALVDAQPGQVTAGLQAEADAIATDAATDHVRLGRFGAEELPQPVDRPLQILAHGSMGPLAGGLVGTGFAVAQAVASHGREVHVWLTEAAPDGEGRRLAASELALQDIAHTVIPDTAVAWLLAEQPLDAVLLRADYVCANGDMAALLGALNVARLAGLADVPVYGCAPTLVVDASAPEARDVPRRRDRPELDVLPAATISAYMTERGLLRPPYGLALAADARAAAPG